MSRVREGAPRIRQLTLQETDGRWRLMVDDVGQPAWTIGDRVRAMRVARRAAADHDATLTIVREDGVQPS